MKQTSRRDVFGEQRHKEQRLLKQHPVPWGQAWGRMHALGAAGSGGPIATCKAVVVFRELLLWWNDFWFL